MENINMTVKDLKEIIKDLPDNMEVIMPIVDMDDNNKIMVFRRIRTAGILTSKYESHPALCLNTSTDGIDISAQIKMLGEMAGVICEKILR